MNNKIINFPVNWIHSEPPQNEIQQEPLQNEINLDEIEVPEVDDIDYEKLYEANEEYECVKCGRKFTEENQTWVISKRPNQSILYNCDDDIAICDNCIAEFLGINKKTSD